MTESEWRGIGVQQSQGWIHYMKHAPGDHFFFPHGLDYIKDLGLLLS